LVEQPDETRKALFLFDSIRDEKNSVSVEQPDGDEKRMT
jgi:hypothetical protein